MTRAIKVTFLVAAALGLSFGVYSGYSDANETSHLLESSQYIAPTKIASDFARAQFTHADSNHARQAVMLQIHLLEQLELADKDFHDDGQLIFAYVRLAMIEEATGQPDAEQRAMAQARACHGRAHSRSEEMTDDELKKVVKRFDQAADNL
jgi:2,4-dienoyl-CoA reductase-like NADH-dependent reductase (Old Yellow Enzyme family)